MFYSAPSSSTGGAGARGILSGMIAGQQSKEASQRMDMLQAKQDKADEQYEQGEAFGRISNIDEMIKSGKINQKMLDESNNWFKNSKHFNDTQFGIQNSAGLKDENGNYSNEFLNKYKADTGKDWLVGSANESDKEGLKNYIDSSGNQVTVNGKVFDPDTFTAGSASYKNYKEQKDLSKQLMEAKIKKELKGTGDVDGPSYAELKVLKDKGLLPESMVPMFKQSQEKAKRAKGDARDSLASQPFKADVQSTKDGGTLGEGYNKALQLEQQAEGNYKNKVLDDQITSYRDMQQVKTDVTNLIESGVNMGATKGYASEAAKYAKDYDSMSQEEKQKQLNTIVMKSKIGGLVSRYLKAMSGTAVTEEEFNRQLENIVGGDISKMNAQTVMAAMQATVDDVGKSVSSQVDAIEPMYPASKMWRYDRLNKSRNLKPGNLPNTSGGTGEKTVEETGLEGVADEAAAGLEYGTKAAKTLLDKILSGDGTPEEIEQAKKLPIWKRALVTMGFMDKPKVNPKPTTLGGTTPVGGVAEKSAPMDIINSPDAAKIIGGMKDPTAWGLALLDSLKGNPTEYNKVLKVLQNYERGK